MTDQAKRWTAIDRGIYHGKDLVACGNKVWGKLSDDCATAARLAACADLLRGVGGLSAVAVMAWADVEKIRQALCWLSERSDTYGEGIADAALDLLPRRPQS